MADAKKVAMNQAQINHFEKRVAQIKKIKERELSERLEDETPTLTDEQRLGYIATGQAELKESINPDECQHKYLLRSFDYPGDHEREAKKRELTGRHGKATKAIDRHQQRLLDRFVLRKFKTEDAVEAALEEFEERDFWGE